MFVGVRGAAYPGGVVAHLGLALNCATTEGAGCWRSQCSTVLAGLLRNSSKLEKSNLRIRELYLTNRLPMMKAHSLST